MPQTQRRRWQCILYDSLLLDCCTHAATQIRASLVLVLALTYCGKPHAAILADWDTGFNLLFNCTPLAHRSSDVWQETGAANGGRAGQSNIDCMHFGGNSSGKHIQGLTSGRQGYNPNTQPGARPRVLRNERDVCVPQAETWMHSHSRYPGRLQLITTVNSRLNGPAHVHMPNCLYKLTTCPDAGTSGVINGAPGPHACTLNQGPTT